MHENKNNSTQNDKKLNNLNKEYNTDFRLDFLLIIKQLNSIYYNLHR